MINITSLENFLIKQLLSKHIDGYVQRLAQLNAKQGIQLQQAKQQQLAQQKLTEAAQLKQYEQAQKIKLLEGLLAQQQQFTRKEQAEKTRQQAIDPSAKTVTDTKNKLMWAVNANQKDDFPNPNKLISLHQVNAYISAANKQKFGGFNNWRLPTQQELSTLLLPKPVNQWWIDTNLFFDTKWAAKGVYWTSSTTFVFGVVSKPQVVVSFILGFCYTATSENAYQLRLVRSI